MVKQTILLVDDEAEIREGLRILLSGENYLSFGYYDARFVRLACL